MNKAYKRFAFLSAVLLMVTYALSVAADTPTYQGKASVDIQTGFSFDEFASRGVFIEYGERDEWGRATYAMGCLGKELVAGDRASMSNLEPTGWQKDAYDFIEGKYLYNRCHLVGHQFAGAEGIENIVTGTRYLNINGMLPYENKVSEYIQRTGNHVYIAPHPFIMEQISYVTELFLNQNRSKIPSFSFLFFALMFSQA